MIVCTKCGFSNVAADSFCGSCGSFLEWTGSKVAEPPAEPVAPAPEPAPQPAAPEHQTFMGRVRDVVGLGGAPATDEAGGELVGSTAEPGGPGVVDADSAATAAPDAAMERAASSASVVVSGTRIYRMAEPEPEPEPEPPEPPEPAPEPEPEPAPVPQPEPEPEPEPPAPEPEAQPRIRPALGGPAAATPKPRPLVEVARPAPPAAAMPPAAEPPAAASTDQPPAARPAALPPSQPPAARPSRPAAPPVAPLPVQPAPAQPAPPPDQPASRQPIAVRPGPERARQAARQAQAETPPANPGDLICGNCRIGNEPTRRFCRRCGQSLAEAVVAEARKLPWYRRIFRRQRTVAAAGERPRSMRTDGRGARQGSSSGRLVRAVLQILVVALIVGAVVGYAVVPDFQKTVNSTISSIRQKVAPNLVSVRTAGQATGASAKGHPAQAAFDGFNNTYWAAPTTGGASPVISASFSPATDISKVLVTSGAVPDFQGSPRPHDVTVEFLDATGVVVTAKDLELKDTKDPQSFDVSAAGVTTFRLTVKSSYASSGGTNVAITEVEFLVAK